MLVEHPAIQIWLHRFCSTNAQLQQEHLKNATQTSSVLMEIFAPQNANNKIKSDQRPQCGAGVLVCLSISNNREPQCIQTAVALFGRYSLLRWHVAENKLDVEKAKLIAVKLGSTREKKAGYGKHKLAKKLGLRWK